MGQSASSATLETIQKWEGLIKKRVLLPSKGPQKTEEKGQQEPHEVQQMEMQSPALGEKQLRADWLEAISWKAAWK